MQVYEVKVVLLRDLVRDSRYPLVSEVQFHGLTVTLRHCCIHIIVEL